jgi:hypothetical protein
MLRIAEFIALTLMASNACSGCLLTWGGTSLEVLNIPLRAGFVAFFFLILANTPRMSRTVLRRRTGWQYSGFRQR